MGSGVFIISDCITTSFLYNHRQILSLSFHICYMGIIPVSTSYSFGENETTHLQYLTLDWAHGLMFIQVRCYLDCNYY